MVRQDLAREHGLTVSLRAVERAVARLRQALRAAARATTRFETAPGEQLQIDFGERRARIAGVAEKRYFFELMLSGVGGSVPPSLRSAAESGETLAEPEEDASAPSATLLAETPHQLAENGRTQSQPPGSGATPTMTPSSEYVVRLTSPSSSMVIPNARPFSAATISTSVGSVTASVSPLALTTA